MSRQPPAESLGDALVALVHKAVKEALAEMRVAGGDNSTMVSISEAAARLGLGKTKLSELIRTGDLPSVKVGHRRLLRPADLEEFAARRGVRR
jgi:excisionase family DNA binding protein